MSATPILRREQREHVVVVFLQHGVNAIDNDLVAAVDGELDTLERAGSPPLVLASAHPNIFSPGLDLKKLDGCRREEMRDLITGFLALLRRLATYPGPTVAAVSGHAIAGGCLLALACDRR